MEEKKTWEQQMAEAKENYLGETVVDIKDSPYKKYTSIDWAMYFIEYGQIDGAHHKQWALDQAARILKGTKVIVHLAKWKDGTEKYRVQTDTPSNEYMLWVEEMRGAYNEEEEDYEYDYDEGIAP